MMLLLVEHYRIASSTNACVAASHVVSVGVVERFPVLENMYFLDTKPYHYVLLAKWALPVPFTLHIGYNKENVLKQVPLNST